MNSVLLQVDGFHIITSFWRKCPARFNFPKLIIKCKGTTNYIKLYQDHTQSFGEHKNERGNP